MSNRLDTNATRPVTLEEDWNNTFMLSMTHEVLVEEAIETYAKTQPASTASSSPSTSLTLPSFSFLIPRVDDISPNFGTIAGGEYIILTGTNFLTTDLVLPENSNETDQNIIDNETDALDIACGTQQHSIFTTDETAMEDAPASTSLSTSIQPAYVVCNSTVPCTQRPVRVLFDGKECDVVNIVSNTKMIVRTPTWKPTATEEQEERDKDDLEQWSILQKNKKSSIDSLMVKAGQGKRPTMSAAKRRRKNQDPLPSFIEIIVTQNGISKSSWKDATSIEIASRSPLFHWRKTRIDEEEVKLSSTEQVSPMVSVYIM